jgi:hypothetical protein
LCGLITGNIITEEKKRGNQKQILGCNQTIRTPFWLLLSLKINLANGQSLNPHGAEKLYTGDQTT